ncbi:MAG: bifunctional enoyl-CoA hydratase/phosphate acetyltransferase [Alphaproteobacteria bacterium]|nr:bifunctional enoyl-CoA hydratase/phosphate acetyltransferase [Alphaproteobacteria bacterium]
MTETWLENKTYDEIKVGDVARLTRNLTQRDIELFAVVSGDVNPAHLDESYARDSLFHGLIAHGLFGGALISAVLGTKLPGPGTIYLSQDLQFLRPVRPNDSIDVTVTVLSKEDEKKIVVLDCVATNQDGKDVIKGTARVIAPTEKIRRAMIGLPEVEVLHHDRIRQLVDHAKKLTPQRTAVVHPCDDVSLQGMDSAAQEGLIIPVLVGPESKIRAAAEIAGVDLKNYEIVSTAHSHAAAIEAVAMARDGRVSTLMKGSLHTDELMSAVVHKDLGLRTERRMSHVFVMDVPTYKWPLLITDAALNIAPDLIVKKDICQNAIYLAHDLGMNQPRLALLAATETVNINMQATLDAAALCKMADRGQITGGILDGPLAFDNAISVQAAKIKHITSPVAGHADILVVPNIEAGNMVAKQLSYLAAAESAGVVLGGRVPVILTSRADNAQARLGSSALAVLTAAGDKSRADAAAAGKA